MEENDYETEQNIGAGAQAINMNIPLETMQALIASINALKTVTESLRQEKQEPRDNIVMETAGQQRGTERLGTSSVAEIANVKIYDLPQFSGKVEEWPMFISNYNETTAAFNYSNRQNLFRLQKCLTGDAREAVASLLIYPRDVPNIIDELKMRFGRSELLARDQLLKLQELPIITVAKIDQIVGFASKVRNVVALLTSAECEHHLSNSFLIEQIVSKLPMNQRLDWARYSASRQTHANLKDLSVWLSDLAKVVCTIPQVEKGSDKGKPQRMLLAKEEPSKKGCYHCKGEHELKSCSEFLNMNSDDKWKHVKEHRVCFSCLKKGHNSAACRFKKDCNVNGCQRKHHPSLHKDESNASTLSSPLPVMSCRSASSDSGLFKIVPVVLSGPTGQVEAYAMIDEGSAVSLIEEKVALKLGVRGQQRPLRLKWFGDTVSQQPSAMVQVGIKAKNQPQEFTLRRLRTIKDLNLPVQSLSKNDYEHLAALDIENYRDAKPTILLGLDNAALSVAHESVLGAATAPVAIRTKLGWIAYGPSQVATKYPRALHISEEQGCEELHNLVREYFSTDNYGTNNLESMPESEENHCARVILNQTTMRCGKGFETGLLWKDYPPNLPNSLEMAKKRLSSIEKKMKHDEGFAEKYKAEMKKYFGNGYARILSEEEICMEQSLKWYLPHFAVTNIHKPDKCRIVFDAAAAVEGMALNSALVKGPEKVIGLMNILFNFRTHRIGVTADIREMFLQIKIRQQDQNCQRFLWRVDDKEIQHCIMTSMIFGAACSPCCAEFVKNYNADEFANEFPEATDIIKYKHYVDDMVCSFSSEEEAITRSSEVKRIHQQGGFELRKFISNSQRVENELNETTLKQQTVVAMAGTASTEKVLGMVWNTAIDAFEFHTKFHRVPEPVLRGERPPTKRELLSVVMSVFDPFGFLADFMLYAKILVQDTWKLRVGWDEEVPNPIFKRWQRWGDKLNDIRNVKIPRRYSSKLFSVETAELHIFVDASQVAFSAVAYLRIAESNEISFVCGKTRIAPSKVMSIPRLELQAAVLGVRVSQMVVNAQDIKFSRLTFWSDSRTVLFWVHSKKRKYSAFVGHRMAEILSVTQPKQWRWVPTTLNPADAATRVQKTPSIRGDSLWLRGPAFLSLDEKYWPEIGVGEMNGLDHEDEESSCLIMNCQASIDLINFNRFSSYFKLKRVCALFLRACGKFKHEKNEVTSAKVIGVKELIAAEIFICRIIQQESFSGELAVLKLSKTLPKTSQLYKLQPYLDEDGLIRMCGRLDEAMYLPLTARRPIVLPQKHTVVDLIIRYYHESFCHQNSALVMNEIRQKFWILHLKAAAGNVQKQCLKCQHDRAKPKPPLMGQLPEDRVEPFVRPFTYTGVDMFGPVMVAVGRSRQKRWGVLFTCLTIRAAHIELAQDLSTDAFILCLRNFVNRRGTPVRIRCDNGTNFLGAQRELKEGERLLDVDRIQNEAGKSNIEFVFNCPANPSSGGAWERLIRIIKRFMYQSLKEVAPRLETLRSVLIEAENVINSRPLTELPLNSMDDEPLTPNHFLLGCVNSTQTPHEEQPIGRIVCLKKQWRIAQMLKDRLWKRWVLEYLPQLMIRSKWNDRSPPIKIDDVVIICDPNQPRSLWQKGRITNVVMAKDGQIRIAEVKTSTGTFRRPVSRLAVLDVGKSG